MVKLSIPAILSAKIDGVGLAKAGKVVKAVNSDLAILASSDPASRRRGAVSRPRVPA